MSKIMLAKNTSTVFDSKPNIDNKILEDYYKFFTTEEGVDMLPYTYLENPRAFDDLVKNSQDYYLFREEVKLLQENQSILTDYLSKVKSVVELGPGSTHSLTHKTISILNCVPNLATYYPVDISENYLRDAYRVVKSKLPKVKVLGLEADMRNLFSLNIDNNLQEQKALLLLGSTLGGQTTYEQDLILKGIYHVLAKDDIFILTIDTNHDERSLMKAYNNQYTEIFTKASLQYFTNYCLDFEKKVEELEMHCEWDEKLKYINIYFVSNKKLTFNYPGYGIINISKDQKLKGIKSRKYTQQTTLKQLKKNNFQVLDILSNDNHMNIFICKRN